VLAGLQQAAPDCQSCGTLSTVATRPVLRIFISSTAVDLRDYRDKVRDAVLRLEGLPIKEGIVDSARKLFNRLALRVSLSTRLWPVSV
jgi:hypothetical protein